MKDAARGKLEEQNEKEREIKTDFGLGDDYGSLAYSASVSFFI